MYAVYLKNDSNRKTIYNQSWLKVGEYNVSATLFNPVLSLEDNSAGSFTAIMPKGNQGYDDVNVLTSEVEICKIGYTTSGFTESRVWLGRVVNAQEDFNLNKSLECEGVLAYLNDTVQPQKKYSRDSSPHVYFNGILTQHNSKVADKKKIQLGTCEFSQWPTDPNVDTSEVADDDERTIEDQYLLTAYESTFDCLKNGIEQLKKAHIAIRWSANGNVCYLDILKDDNGVTGSWGKNRLSNQEIRLGVNLLDYAKSWDISDVASVIYPLGARRNDERAHVGEPITYTQISVTGYAGSTIGEDGNIIGMNNSRWKVGRITTTPGKKFFYSGTNWNGYGMYCFQNANSEVIEVHNSDTTTSQEGISTTLIEHLIEAPADTKYLYIAGTETPELTLYDYLPDEDAEEYVTIKNIIDNTAGRHAKQKGELCVVNDTLYNRYGCIEKVIQFENIKNPQLLYERALKYFEDDVYADMVLEVKALDLNYLDKTYESFKIGALVPVISAPHSMDYLDFPISAIELHLDRPDESLVTLGRRKKKTISGITNVSSANINKKITEEAKNTSQTLNDVRSEATSLIINGFEGYVTLVRDPNNKNIIREIVISDNPDYMRARNVWRWNKNGLGFSNQGYNPSQFVTAITADGKIVSEFIAGTRIYGVNLEGGSLKLGYGFRDSEFKMYTYSSDLNNSFVGTSIDETGIEQQHYNADLHQMQKVRINKAFIQGYISAVGGGYDVTGSINFCTSGGKMQILSMVGDLVTASKYDIVFTVATLDTRSSDNPTFVKVGTMDLNGLHLNRGNYTGSFVDADGYTYYVEHGLITRRA